MQQALLTPAIFVTEQWILRGCPVLTDKLAFVLRGVYAIEGLRCKEQTEGKPWSNLMAPLPIYIYHYGEPSSNERRGREGQRGRGAEKTLESGNQEIYVNNNE